jgi:hypothetical protein
LAEGPADAHCGVLDVWENRRAKSGRRIALKVIVLPALRSAATAHPDRLLWLVLRRLWPQWRDALVLVQPATVDRWYRDRFDRRWWRRSR